MPLALALTDAQFAAVTEAAALMPPSAHDAFPRSVAAVLGDNLRPSDAESPQSAASAPGYAGSGSSRPHPGIRK